MLLSRTDPFTTPRPLWALGYAFDRLGRQIAVTNGATICSWNYNDANEQTSESYTGGPLDGLCVTNGFDSLLRRTNLALHSQLSTLSSTAYGYDTVSRLQTVTDGTNSASYRYLDNSPLVSQITFTNNGMRRMTTAKQYDYLNRLTQISTTPSGVGAVPISFSYNYNTANQRTSLTNADSSYWVYQYDSLGQVVSGKKYWANGTPVAGQQFTYNFDDIGNRKSTGSGGDTTGSNLRTANYTANNLNQYTSRDVPGYVDVLGSANPKATVTVNLQRAVRQGGFFWDELGVNNTGSSLYLSLTNLAVLNNGTNADIIATNIGSVFVSQTPQTFAYDADGNLINDGRWNYIWDADNRLVQMTVITNVGPQYRLTFMYDFQGRRMEKIVSTNNGTMYIGVSTNLLVYDGWNPIVVINPESSALLTFSWGTDLSGSLQGAGGVGGLLFFDSYSNMQLRASSYYAYDGNGNVAGLVAANNGTIAAHYEYDPFGNVLRATGPLAEENPFQFSTKWFDREIGLNYYGFRYFNPMTGTWSSRDPLEETGGINLYSILDNDSINEADYYGLAPTFKLTVSIPQISVRPVTVFPGFDVDGKIEAQLSLEGTVTCCSGTHKIVKGSLTSKGTGEVGGTFGKRLDYSTHLPMGGFVALQGLVGIRLYAGIMASGQGNFIYDGCKQTFFLSTDIKGGGYVGVEGGVMGNAIVDFWRFQGSYGFGATVYGQGNLNADINVNCDLLGCNVDSSIQGNFEYGFKAKFWRTALTIKGTSPTHEWIKAHNRVDFPWASYFNGF